VSNTGQIGASDAAAFLKKSGLKEGILHKVSIALFFTVISTCRACQYANQMTNLQHN